MGLIDTIGVGGGAEGLLRSLLPRMRQRGLEVELAALFDWPETHVAALAGEGIPVHQLRLSGPKAIGPAMAKLHRLVREVRPRLCWGHLFYGNVAARLAGRLARVPAVATFHSRLVQPGQRPRRWVASAERVLLGGAAAKVAVSAAVQRERAAAFGWPDMAVIHNGIDCGWVEGLAAPANVAQARARIGVVGDELLLVTPARLVPTKGHLVLIAALARLRAEGAPPVRLILCGEDGPAREAILQAIAAHALQEAVALPVFLPPERLFPLLAAADMVVLPSLSEGFGLAAAEAMALGTACVLTDVDGLSELAAGADCALLVPSDDPGALAAALARLIADPGLRRRLGAAAAQHVRNRFDIAECADHWASLLRQTIAQAR